MATATISKIQAKFRSTNGVTPSGETKYKTFNFPAIDNATERTTIINGVWAVNQAIMPITISPLVQPVIVETSIITAA